MFRIITPDGSTILTEKPNFIRRYKNGCFILCAREKAEGVAYAGKPYLFADGANVSEFDGADELRKLYSENEALSEQLAATDEATIELFETALMQEEINAEQDEATVELFESTLAQEEINAEQDEAIIAIYEMMEGTING